MEPRLKLNEIILAAKSNFYFISDFTSETK